MEVDELRRRIDLQVKWYRDGIQDGRTTGSDVIREIAHATRPTEIAYFIEVAPETLLRATAQSLAYFKDEFDFLLPFVEHTDAYLRYTAEEMERSRLALQPVYYEIHRTFCVLTKQRGVGFSEEKREI
jgi:hypothetical protein